MAATLVGQRRKQQAAMQLKGEVLALSADYVGCRLYSRCPFAQPRCAEERQELRELAPGHRVRCWRAEDIQMGLMTEVKNVQNTLP
ncbi:MAG: hypothetical protein HC875_26890 [Anaerolineales bacterium]|nr:hypothetical protein [Anaerolineales bacterium]